MGKVYRSLRGVVQEKLHLSKTNSLVLARVKGSDAVSMNDAMEELEKTLVDRIGRLKTAVSERQAAAANEAQYTEQVTEILRANIAALEAKLRDSEEAVNRKDVANQKMEESLGLTIRDLQSAVKEKEEVLANRVSEVNDLKLQQSLLELAVQQAREEMASEAQRAEDLTESFKGKIATLEAQLRQTEQTVRAKDWSLQDLTAKIQDLETQLRDKGELLEAQLRQTEQTVRAKDWSLQDLTAKIQDLETQLRDKGELLETQRRQAEETIRGKDWTLQNLTAKIQDLEAQVRDKEELLEDRDSEVTGLNAELERLRNGVKEMSSFFRATKALDSQAPAIDKVVGGAQLATGEEKPPTSQSHDVGVTSHITDAARETMARDAFDFMIAEFGESTNIMDTMASLIVRNHVKALGESLESFPKTRLAELIDKLSQEILDERLRTGFRERLGRL